MAIQYYFDTSVWRDYYEDRRGQGGRPLGEYAARLMVKVIRQNQTILYSDLVVRELMKDYGKKEIENLLKVLLLSGTLAKVEILDAQGLEAMKLSKERKMPRADALHAIIARDNDAVLVSQDKHFQELKDLVAVKRPEELL